MDSLPEIEYKVLDTTQIIDCNNETQMETFYAHVKDLIGADCWAVKIDDEILFNSYNTSKPMLDKIQDRMVRNTLISDVHGALFVDLFRGQKERIIVLYMFGEKCWFYHIGYFDSTKVIHVNKYYSTKYLESYGNVE